MPPIEESTAQRLREIGGELDKLYTDLDKSTGRGQWLRGLQARTRKLASTTLATLPRADNKRQKAWTETALALLKPQYDEWMQQLNAILDRVKPT